MLEWLLTTVLHLPKSWLVVGNIFVLLSMFDVAWVSTTGLSLAFRVTTTTALFLALIWLPALLRVFALLGGGIKTPAGEFTSSGLGTLTHMLDSETLGILIAETTTAEEQVPLHQQLEVHQIRQELQGEYLSRIPSGKAREEMHQLAQHYNSLRKEMSSGSERTREMGSIAERMRILAPLAELTSNEIDAYLHSDDGGKRLLGLSAVRATRSISHFEQVLQIVDIPQSGYEQFQALRILEELLPDLTRKQKEWLREILKRIPLDSNRAYLSTRLLTALGTP
jgi:hypothetical protein